MEFESVEKLLDDETKISVSSFSLSSLQNDALSADDVLTRCLPVVFFFLVRRFFFFSAIGGGGGANASTSESPETEEL